MKNLFSGITLSLFIASQAIAASTDFNNALDAAGGIISDLSASSKISLAEPALAHINISGFDRMPESKTAEWNGWLEFFDGNGNYFKKRIIASAQGSSSLGYPKKNLKFDLCEDEWIGDDTPDVAFGNWVKQDGFHLKAYYIDYFRGVGAVSYRIFEDMIADRGDRAYAWQRAGVEDADPKALCHPDGFPAIVYLNGDFYGVFAFQLKKHRKNMGMDKKTAEHIHLDGEITSTDLFYRSIDWTKFEVRNPKSLVCMDGSDYDGDNPAELIDESSSFFNASDANHVRSAQVKKYIQTLSNYCPALDRFEREGYTPEQMRREFEERFDINGFIDYTVFSAVTNNVDGWWKNWQWTTYDGKKWFVEPYDLDMTFGNLSFGYYVSPPEYNWYYDDKPFTRFQIEVGPSVYLHRYYADDLDARYAQLRDNGAISVENIYGKVVDWYNRVGEENYEREYQVWNQSYCNRDLILDPAWEWKGTWVGLWSTPAWEENRTYRKGASVSANNMIFVAKEQNRGHFPVVQQGYRDGLDRINDWITRRIEYQDEYMHYQGNTNALPSLSAEESDTPAGEIVAIHDALGCRRAALAPGLNIVTYANGRIAKILR